MTKAEMIKTIKEAEAKAWLEIAKYSLDNKPIVTTWAEERAYNETDIGYIKNVNQWYSLKMLMETLEIDSDFDEAHQEACDIAHEIWTREQNAKGVYYDERGNRTA